MKTVKRWISMLLVVAMLLSLTGTVTYAADNALTVSAGAVTVDVSTDKTVTIPVTVKNNPGFAVGGFNVEYDTTALTFTSAELVADFTNISTNKKTPGNIGVFVERDKNYTEDGVLLNLKFTVTDSAQNGEYSVKLVQNDMYEFINWDTETTITNVNFVSGSVTVSGVAAQPQVTSLVLKKTTTDTDLTELKLSISKVGTVYSSSVRAEFEAEEGADTTVTWESSNENVAAVENKVNTSTGKNFCRITTKGLGTAIITAHCGALTASFTLTISAFDSTELSVVNEKDSSYLYFTLKSDDTVAPTVQLTTKPKYDLTVLENVQWSSSNENVATVDEKGLVTITGIGSAVITATGTCVGSGTVAKGTASITANPDSSELPTITVKKGDKVISNQSGYSAEEQILPIGSTITLKAEQSKTSFTWLGKTYSYKLAANTDWVYSDTGATGTVTVKDNGEIRVTAASYSTAGKKLAIKVYAEGASDSYVYCAFRLIAKTGLTQAEDGYFEIYNANDLKEFADLVNNTACTNAIGGQPEKNLNLRLMNDIDMTSINSTYIPIGSAINGKFGNYASQKYYSWCGDFDGNNHKIYNIDYTAQNRSNVTLFDNSGVIFTTAGSCHDLTVEGKVKTASNWTGALCGVGQCSKYENVISKLEINAGKASSVSGIGGSDQRATFKNCVNYSNIISNSEAKYSYVGGIALQGAVVENCQNFGRLESTNPNAEISGIVQYSRAVGYVIRISQCANYGDIIGAKAAGVVADFEPRGNGSVVDCYNWGEIKGSVYAGGVIGRVDLAAYGNSLKMSGCYNYGSVTSDDSSATLGELIGKISLGSSVPTNSVEKCFYNEDSGNDAIGTIANSSSIVYEAPEFTAISQNDFATLAEKLGEKFQNSCPAPVFTWQQAKGHAYGTVVTYDWHLNTETGAYDACTASVECTECGSKLSQALTVEREVARTDCTKERTVTYTATGTINGVAADDTRTDILPAGTHEVNSAKWASDGDAHWHVCANCNVRVDETAHTNNGWKTDANNHWHECTVCGSSYDLDKHSGGTATTTERAKCETCGQEYGELLPKVTSLKLMRTTTNDELTGTEFELTLYSISGSYSSSIRAEFEAEEGADTTVTWTISDENVATVENYVNTSTGKNFCKITPKGLGTATLTAHCGDLEASLQLTLAGPVATELKIKTSADKGYKTFYLHSTDTEAPTEQMKATTSYALSVVKDITWSSSNEDVLKVDANTGLVTVTGLGTSTITAQGTNAKGAAIKGSMSIDVQVDRSELPTITVKRGGETISAKSTSEIPTELYIPINQSLTVTTEIDKTSFTWMGKEYPYVITATRDYYYSKTGARITQQADGTWLIEKERSSETGKLVYFDFRTTIGGYLKSCYIKLKFTNETNLTQAADGYYQIYTAADLKEFADLVNNTVCTDKIGGRPEKNFNLRLMADIDMTPINDTYIPIGSAVDGTYGQYQSWGYYRWTGDFDGNNHKIYNVDITVKKPAKVSPGFGWGVLVTSGGSIHDLTVDGKVKADSSWTDWFSGVGEASTYKNVTSNLDIDAGNARFVAGIGSKASMCTFENCVNNGNITGNGNVYGIGSRALNVTRCVNNGKLVSTGEKASVVGIVDQTRSNGNTTNIAVSECANFGELVSAGSAAGIIGEATPGATGYIKDCYNMGSITGVTAAGGIVGTLYMTSSGNLLTMNNCYNYGAISATGTDAAKGEIIANMNYGWNKADIAITNCYYNEASGNSGIGAVKNDDNITYTEPVFTAIPQVEFATLADKLGDKFQSSCPAPVFTWQQAKAHDYGADISYNWHLNSETGVYDACTASVTCTECGSPLTQALTVKRDVARTDCTQERTVTYTATGTINGLAASDTMTDILPAGNHEVDPAQWTGNENTHWHVCANCDVRVDEAAHSGGSATTTERARCEICGHEYGELLPRTYTVKFDANGGEGTMDDQTFTYDVEQALSANVFTKTGYTFAGWKDAQGNTYTDGQTVKNLATEGALTLTAQWTANSYTVKFDGNGAEGTMADQSFTYDVEQALTANGFTKTGYTFAGWKLDDTTYEDGATVKNLATSGEITLIAQWTAIKKDDGASTGDSGIIAWGAAMPVAVLAAAYVIGRKKREE